MLKSIKHFAKLCVLRGNPADVDGRTHTLVILFLILLVLDPIIVLTAVWATTSTFSVTYQNMVDEVILRVLSKICVQLFVALSVYAILQFRNVPQKFRQTFSSYLGVSIIISLVSSVLIVATVLWSSFGELNEFFDPRKGFVLATGLVFFAFVLVEIVANVWKILAFGHILFKSMEVEFWQGVIVAIVLIFAHDGLLESFLEIFGIVVSAISYVSGVGFS